MTADLAYGGLVMDGAGNLYGATSDGGSGHGGVVYELSPYGGGWTYQILYSLFGAEGPYGSLTLDAAGNLYGAAFGDGATEAGMIFKLAPSNGSWIVHRPPRLRFQGRVFSLWRSGRRRQRQSLWHGVRGAVRMGKAPIWEITP